AADRRVSLLLGLTLLVVPGLSHDRSRPGAIEDRREVARLVPRMLISERRVDGDLALPCTPLLDPRGDVPGDPVEEGAEPAGTRGIDLLESAALAEALHEDLLERIVDIVRPRRVLPACLKVRARDRSIPAGEALAPGGVSCCGLPDRDPAR